MLPKDCSCCSVQWPLDECKSKISGGPVIGQSTNHFKNNTVKSFPNAVAVTSVFMTTMFYFLLLYFHLGSFKTISKSGNNLSVAEISKIHRHRWRYWLYFFRSLYYQISTGIYFEIKSTCIYVIKIMESFFHLHLPYWVLYKKVVAIVPYFSHKFHMFT